MHCSLRISFAILIIERTIFWSGRTRSLTFILYFCSFLVNLHIVAKDWTFRLMIDVTSSYFLTWKCDIKPANAALQTYQWLFITVILVAFVTIFQFHHISLLAMTVPIVSSSQFSVWTSLTIEMVGLYTFWVILTIVLCRIIRCSWSLWMQLRHWLLYCFHLIKLLIIYRISPVFHWSGVEAEKIGIVLLNIINLIRVGSK
jgi:hypothetical protein